MCILGRLLASIRKVGVQNAIAREHNNMKIKQFSLKSGRPQEAWTPIWLKAGCSIISLFV